MILLLTYRFFIKKRFFTFKNTNETGFIKKIFILNHGVLFLRVFILPYKYFFKFIYLNEQRRL